VAEAPAPESAPSFFARENLITFVFCEAIGGPFCYAAAQEIMDGQWLKGVAGFAVGLPFAVLGFLLPAMGTSALARSARGVASDFRWWLVAMLPALVLMAWPATEALRSVRSSSAARHLTHAAHVNLMDALAPYGLTPLGTTIELQGFAQLVRCQTVEAAELLRDIYDVFYETRWNVHEVTGEAAKFDHDGAVYVQGQCTDELSDAFKRAFSDSGIVAHVRTRSISKSDKPNLAINVDCNMGE
jgi:hypothetical protein